MKRLIVNADDLGADEARNEGIFEAIGAGVVTSVSLLANGPAFGHAAERLRTLGGTVSVGLHLNLSEGAPVSGGVRRLLGPDGLFRGKAAARKALLGRRTGDLEQEIRGELAAQLETLDRAGLRVDHLDGHQHVHVFPTVLGAALEACRARRIRWLRVPDDRSPAPPTARGGAQREEEALLFARLGALARLRLGFAGISAPRRFLGLHLLGRLYPAGLEHLAARLEDGLTELMVHPGRAAPAPSGPFSGFSTSDREDELDTLLSPSFREALERHGVRLVPFPRAKAA